MRNVHLQISVRDLLAMLIATGRLEGVDGDRLQLAIEFSFEHDDIDLPFLFLTLGEHCAPS